VTRGQLPQRAGSPGLNDGGAAATVPRSQSITWLIVTKLNRTTTTNNRKT